MNAIVSLFGGRLPANDPAPLYLRLQERIRHAINSGTLQPLDALPGERDIADAFGVSRVTVRKALAGLVEHGLLRQRQGSGTFVAAPPHKVEQALSRLTSFSDDMRLRGLEPTVEWLGRDVSLASPQEAMRLLISPSERVSRLRRLRLASGVPMAIELATLPVRYLPDPMLVASSLYATLESLGVRPVRALQRLRAASLGADDAALLGTATGAAALAIERIAFLASGEPVEFTQSWYRGDAYDFVAELNLRHDA
jgi:GntR family transcriptional regulator